MNNCIDWYICSCSSFLGTVQRTPFPGSQIHPNPDMYGYVCPWLCGPQPDADAQNACRPLPFRHSQTCTVVTIVRAGRLQTACLAAAAPFRRSRPSQAQPIQAQPIPTLYPPHNAQLEEPLLPRGRPPANVQFLCTQRFSESLAAAVAASPPPMAVVPMPLRLWYRDTGAVMMVVVVVVMSR